MATDSRQEQQQPRHALPPLFDRVATTPPPSYPLLASSDQFPFSDFDSFDWDTLQDDNNFDDEDPIDYSVFDPDRTFFNTTSSYFDSFGPSPQLPPHPHVPSSAPSPRLTSRILQPSLSPRPFSSRHSTGPSPAPPPPRPAAEEPIEAVDLTTTPPENNMAPRRTTKRVAPSTTETRTDSNKKRKRSTTATASQQQQPEATEGAGLPDGDGDENDDAMVDVLQKQMEDQIKSQQQKEKDAPSKLTSLQCIICLEPPTDLTVTSCGHLFCHGCLMPALNTGEPSKSKCPVCRRPVNRVKRSGKALDFQPLELKLKTKSGSGAAGGGGKGKGKEVSGV
ncbi:MAG: SUMO-targeted ubiquitin ligase complex subunit slx8 [Peltula sp. TS41687]|nr:MAG: SUMO-targeted ubiquitin ligase complex subunit slx8 [Peltula sp. TS41687]